MNRIRAILPDAGKFLGVGKKFLFIFVRCQFMYDIPYPEKFECFFPVRIGENIADMIGGLDERVGSVGCTCFPV